MSAFACLSLKPWAMTILPVIAEADSHGEGFHGLMFHIFGDRGEILDVVVDSESCRCEWCFSSGRKGRVNFSIFWSFLKIFMLGLKVVLSFESRPLLGVQGFTLLLDSEKFRHDTGISMTTHTITDCNSL